MAYKSTDQMNFFAEMSEHQIASREFFGDVLVDSLERNFGLKKVLISYFDTEGVFLSWFGENGLLPNREGHPYRAFAANDVIRHVLYQEAVRDHLTYFDVKPRVYKATDIVDPVDYDQSAYVRFLEENFQAHYSVTMAFGINAYIQATFFKSLEEGDFTDEEMTDLNDIYVYVANAYKNFKKYEQAKIVSDIQSEIIELGEKAYLVTDDFLHILSCNKVAQEYLADILGPFAAEQIGSSNSCSWLPFLMEGKDEAAEENGVQTHVIKNYIFKIYTYDQAYSNGIIDRYHWITIAKEGEEKRTEFSGVDTGLTQSEQKIVALMYQGLTYQAMADELVVSYHTVKKHVQNIYSKCGVNSRYELYKWMEDRER